MIQNFRVSIGINAPVHSTIKAITVHMDSFPLTLRTSEQAPFRSMMLPRRVQLGHLVDTPVRLSFEEDDRTACITTRNSRTRASSVSHHESTVHLNEDAAVIASHMPSSHHDGRNNPYPPPFLNAGANKGPAKFNEKLYRTWYRRLDSLFTDTWALEIFFCAVAVTFLVGLSVFLAAHQGATQPQWPYGISINTVVSLLVGGIGGALASVLSACIGQIKWQWFLSPRPLSDIETFDEASRDLYGKLRLLTHSYWRGHHLANFGCLIGLGVLAIEPFAQQIVQYYNCFSVSPNHIAWIPRVNNYTAESKVYPGHSQLDPKMASAIYTGILNPPKTDAGAIKSFRCHSGNCTLPQFSTLGMCHSCHEIMDLIRLNGTFQSYWLDNWPEDPRWPFWREEAKVGWTNESRTTHYTNTPYSMISSRKTLGFDPSIGNAPFDDLITLDFLTLNIDSTCNMTLAETEMCTKHPWAVRCSLYPCIKTFNANITNSMLSENMTSSLPVKKSNNATIEVTTYEVLTWSYAVDTTIRYGQRIDCKPSSIPTANNTVPITSHRTVPISSNQTSMWYPEDCVYELGYPAALAINQFLSVLFDVNSLESRNGSVTDLFGDHWLKPFYNNGMANISTANAYFGSLAGTITGTMRQTGQGAALAEVVGSVLESETCIRVRWPWLTLPIFFVLSTTGFLISTIMSSAWRGVWKTSCLAAVYFGAYNAPLEPLEPRCLHSVMMEAAKHKQVQLYTDK